MPLTTDVNALCPAMIVGVGQFCVTMPGGGEICISPEAGSPGPVSAVKKLLDNFNSALTPLVPIFNVIDVVFAIKDCIDAIPECLGPPPTPRPIFKCGKNLAKKIAALAKLIPQVSIPAMIVQIIDAIIAFLEGYVNELESMVLQLNRIATGSLRAQQLGNLQLEATLECIKANIEVELNNMNGSVEPLARLIGVLNGFLELAGLPCIPAFPALTGLTDEALEPLRDFLDLLRELRKKIPISEEALKPSFSKACN